MTEDSLVDFFDRYVAALNGRLTDQLPGLVADEVEHNGERMTRQEWWDNLVASNVEAVPDLCWHVDEVITAEDRIMVRYTDTGTPVSTFAGREPNGVQVRFREYAFYTLVDGRIEQTWSLVDEAAIRDQLEP